MGSANIDLILNLDKAKVTWVESFVEASRVPGVGFSNNPRPGTRVNLYLGDAIDWDSVLAGSINVYYLAATAFNPRIVASEEEKKQELDNFDRADYVVLISRAELDILKSCHPQLDFAKFMILGFPIDFERLIKFRTEIRERTVCFVSNMTFVKQPEFQIRLCRYLLNAGYQVSHFSSINSEKVEALRAMGCTVYSRLNQHEFLTKLASHEYFINTSIYESLSTSGIEAAAMGVKPICPAIGGLLDWCTAQNQYEVYEPEEILEVMKGARTMTLEEFKWLSGKAFYENLDQRTRS